jgi:hypothetical protein
MLARAQSLSDQFIFDVQTHFVRDDFDHKELLGLGKFASEHWTDCFSLKIRVAPAVFSSAIWASSVWPSVLTRNNR